MAIVIRKRAKAPPPEPVKKSSSGLLLDGTCLAAVSLAPNSMVPWWLMASYAYYHHDMSIISDGLYDQLARDIQTNWASLDHPRKRLITEEHLQAGSLYDLAALDYPSRTRHALAHLLRSHWRVTIDVSHC